MLTPAAKRRRRTEAATATLARPFRSPAVRRGGAAGATLNTEKLARGTATSTPSTGVPASPERKHKRPSQPGPPRPAEPLSLSSLVDQFNSDLDAGDRTLEEVGVENSRSQETGSKEKEIRNTAGSEDLLALIARWREAGRLAAEEVFALVAERVARAGGVKAWRAMTAQPAVGGGGRRDSDGEEEEEKEEDNIEEFTMAMMLASLHVDPDLLGYDEAEERWKE